MSQIIPHFVFLALFTAFIWWRSRPALTRWIVVTRIVANLTVAFGVFLDASYLPKQLSPAQHFLGQTAVFWLIICIGVMFIGFIKEEKAYQRKEVS